MITNTGIDKMGMDKDMENGMTMDKRVKIGTDIDIDMSMDVDTGMSTNTVTDVMGMDEDMEMHMTMGIRRTSVRVALHILYAVRTLVDGSAGGGVLPIAIELELPSCLHRGTL